MSSRTASRPLTSISGLSLIWPLLRTRQARPLVAVMEVGPANADTATLVDICILGGNSPDHIFGGECRSLPP
jgi:hypothetical protein